MDLSIKENYFQPQRGSQAQSTSLNKEKTSFTYQLSANHSAITGPGATIPMRTEDTVYYGMDGNNQDVHVTHPTH